MRYVRLVGAAFAWAVLAEAMVAATPATIVGRDGADMVLVPAGPFTMGTGEAELEAAPPHRRDLPAFYIDRCEVTNACYAKYVAAAGASPPVTWRGAAPAEKRSGLWSVEVSKAAVTGVEGLLPYWSTGEEELFNPERGE